MAVLHQIDVVNGHYAEIQGKPSPRIAFQDGPAGVNQMPLNVDGRVQVDEDVRAPEDHTGPHRKGENASREVVEAQLPIPGDRQRP